MRPMLAEGPSQFVLMERAVEDEYRPRMLQELQQRVEEFAKATRSQSPTCSECGRVMVCQDVRPALTQKEAAIRIRKHGYVVDK